MQTALSRNSCWARAPDWLLWMADRLPSILAQQKHARRAVEAMQSISVNQFHPSILLIDWQFCWIIQQQDTNTDIPSSYGEYGKKSSPSSPKYKVWWTSWEWLDTVHILRLETLEKRERLVMRMSCPSFPTTYLRVGTAFCDNYSA